MAGNPNWKKGISGNPGGRPKEIAEVRMLAQEHTKEAIETLVKIMRNTKATAAARVAASNAILDRGYGKPSQALTGPNDDPLFAHNRMTEEEIDERLAELRAKMFGNGVSH